MTLGEPSEVIIVVQEGLLTAFHFGGSSRKGDLKIRVVKTCRDANPALLLRLVCQQEQVRYEDLLWVFLALI